MKTITDIAKIAGVSKSTVSRYLNNGPVSQQTKAKLDRIISTYNYQPNQFAQSLRANRTKMIGAIIPRMNSFAVDDTIKGVKAGCDALGYQLLLNNTNIDPQLELDALKMFNRSKVDGIIFMATELTEAHLKVIDEIDVPVIVLGQEDKNLYCITHNDYKAGRLVGEAIVNQGTRSVHFFGVPETDVAVGQIRKQGLLDVLKTHHIDYRYTETSFKYEDALDDVSATLNQSHEETEAIIGATDTIALAIHKYMMQNTKQAPKPHIIGFGGDPMTEVVSPAIQTVHYHYKEAGEVAMRQLAECIQGNTIKAHIEIDVTLETDNV
ncbi:LacI family DNA-binding transcriptional regulator [Staphylococcus auricularis]|uniref:LacI family DNA-binding transcriptional regulator n=1 Tax=Staphylococcus auricularis TaxID=29379 RepID=UPI00243201F9|nr:LacI family DNA-binding transcriptional regulator [Staphylococcus auricularis]